MNTVKAGAKYVGEGTTEHGIRFTEVTVAAVGKGEDIKLRVLSTKAGGDALGSCSKGANLIIVGRLYRNRAVQGDFNSYLIPTQRIELLSAPITLNDVTIAGAYWLNDNDVKANQTSNERHNFTILTSAPAQQLLSHEYDDTISFSVTSWKYDAERILQTAHKGRQLMIQGYLRSYNGYVSVTVRNGLVEMFGKRKDKEEGNNNVKSVKASSVVIQGETKEEAPI